MTKPEDIPRLSARQIASELSMLNFDGMVEVIDRAIMAAEQREREACAQVAVRLADDWAEASKRLSDAGMISDGTIGAASLGARDIAAAIRNRGENQGD